MEWRGIHSSFDQKSAVVQRRASKDFKEKGVERKKIGVDANREFFSFSVLSRITINLPFYLVGNFF